MIEEDPLIIPIANISGMMDMHPAKSMKITKPKIVKERKNGKMKNLKVKDLIELLDDAERVLVIGVDAQGVDLGIDRASKAYFVEEIPEEIPEVLDLTVYSMYHSSIYRCFVFDCESAD